MTPDAILQAPRPERARMVAQKYEEPGETYQTIADWLEVTRNTVAGLIRDAKQKYARTQTARVDSIAVNDSTGAGVVAQDIIHESGELPSSPHVTTLEWPTFVFTGIEDMPKQPQPVFVEPTIEGSLVVVGDVHCPTCDLELVKLVARIGDEWLPQGARRLLIAGDYFNMNSQNNFRKRLPTAALETEFRYGEMVMNYWLEHFDTVFMILGNHDAWFWQNFGGDFGTARFKRMITKYPDRLEISPYSAVRVHSGEQWWYIPHQKEYRKNKLSVANELAMLEGMNIIATHQHYSAVGRDHSNKHTIVDIGGLHQIQQMAYPYETPNAKPKMCQGFVLLLNGTAHLITPYPSMTDLSLYLPSEGMKRGTKAA